MYRSPDDPERILSTPVRRWHDDQEEVAGDTLAVEEPLEIFAGPLPLAVIMRTPGHDDELAAGFLHGEGLARNREELGALAVWRDAEGNLAQNRVTVTSAGAEASAPAERRFYATSSCGICGKASIEAVLALAPPLAGKTTVAPAILYGLPEQLRAAQSVFEATGALHAAGLFALDGTLLTVREDVGRHNAVDKLIGRALLDGKLPLDQHILLVSGRVSFEIVQKALMARIPIIAAVSAPTSLAVQVARRANITLAGFVRGRRLNIYS